MPITGTNAAPASASSSAPPTASALEGTRFEPSVPPSEPRLVASATFRFPFARTTGDGPLAQLPAVCTTALATAAGRSSALSISSKVRPLVSGPNAQKPMMPRIYQEAK
jgi:hypothetical protein